MREAKWQTESRDSQRFLQAEAAIRLNCQRIRHGNLALHFWPFDLSSTDRRKIVALACAHFHSPCGTSSSLKGRWCRSQPLVPLSLLLCKNRPLSVTMKVSLTLAAALLLPVIVNAQNSNSTSVNVSGICPTVPNHRLTLTLLLRSKLAQVVQFWCSTLRTSLRVMAPA